MNKKAGMNIREKVELPPKIENYNQAVDMITEKGTRALSQQRIQDSTKHAQVEDLQKKLALI
jgi:t-SNARE complex subunit (syntaxin)